MPIGHAVKFYESQNFTKLRHRTVRSAAATQPGGVLARPATRAHVVDRSAEREFRRFGLIRAKPGSDLIFARQRDFFATDMS